MTAKVVGIFDAAAKPWPERGTTKLVADHAEYLGSRGIRKSYWKLAGYRSDADGLIIPYPRPEGEFAPDFARKRLIPAAAEAKFIQPARSRNRLYFAPLTRARRWSEIAAVATVPIELCEGEIKAAALAQYGHAAVAIGGVYNWRYRPEGRDGPSEVIPDFDLVAWADRPVRLNFDADANTNPNVQMALIALAAELRRRKAVVTIRIAPDLGGGKTGIDDLIAADGIRGWEALPALAPDDPALAGWGVPVEPRNTDAGNAVRFALAHGDRVRFVHAWDRWLIWDGSRWRRDDTEHVWNLGREVPKRILREALEAPTDEARAALRKWSATSEATARIEAMLRQARSLKGLAVTPACLDARPLLLGTPGAMIDLERDEVSDPDPALLVTKQTGARFDPRATAPTFERFVSEIMCGDAELVAYLQRVVGYVLTGSTEEQCFFVFYGTGANGKSTFLRVIQDVLGDYATTSRIESWTARERAGSGASEDLARLAGARLVSAMETEDGRRLAESQVKEFTGGDRVTARRLYEGSFEYTPQFKLVLVCNHKPTVSGDDPALWRRLRLVPFTRVFAEAEQDRGLVEKLRAESPGILNWALAGYRAWRRDGLGMPTAVRTATLDYQRDSDLLAQFIDDECEVDRSAETPTIELFGRYQLWAERCGHRYPLTLTRFSMRMQDRGFAKVPGRTRKLAGIRPRKHGGAY